MAKPPRAGWNRTERPGVAYAPSATFRFARPAAFALIHRRATHWQWRALAAAVDRVANSDVPSHAQVKSAAQARFKYAQLTGARHACAQRTADKRPPDLGEMERLHDIYGGIFADGTDQGRS